MAKESKLILLLASALLLILLSTYNAKKAPEVLAEQKNAELGWQYFYEREAQTKLDGYDTYVANTEYYDYKNPMIQTIAAQIAEKSSNEREAIEKALDYVYSNVDYIYDESDQACYAGTAPYILSSGKGQCDTQSISVISLLRAMGIAAKPVGGCVIINPRCTAMAFYLNSFQDMGLAPKFNELTDQELQNPVFSRSSDVSRKGALHAWVTAWTPEDGWITLESTTGKIADTSCYTYHVEIFPEDTQKADICVSKNWNYASACQANNLDLLNQFGVGTVSEVSP